MTTESIMLYKDRNFQGRSYECKGELSDLHSYLSRCNSARVKGGFWVLYERPNYMGYQYVLAPGEYPDYHQWIGFNNFVRSCRLIRHIVFYEDRNFQGRSFKCSMDCQELLSHLSRCNSIRVESGSWVLYEHPNFMGYQYILTRGEYPDYQHWLGFNDSIRSCRMVQNNTGIHRIRLYERPEFQGQVMECTEDWPSVYDRFRHREIHSCNVLDGGWVFFEQPNYRGQQYLLERGKYRSYTDWNAMHPTVGSICRVQEF